MEISSAVKTFAAAWAEMDPYDKGYITGRMEEKAEQKRKQKDKKKNGPEK